jgi:hypothetical protein
MALFGHAGMVAACPLSGAEQTVPQLGHDFRF